MRLARTCFVVFASLTCASALTVVRDPGTAEQRLEQRRNASRNVDLKHMKVWDLYPELGDKLKLRMPVIRTRSHNQCGILWFYHIPKCGGTAVGEWLERMQAYGYLDAVLPLMSMTERVDFDAFRANHLDPILENPDGRLVAVHHHHRGPPLDGFNVTFDDMQAKLQASGCDLIRVTFLREAVDREVSALYYNWNEAEFSDVLKDMSYAEMHNGEVRYILNNKMHEYDLEPFPFGETVDDDTWQAGLTRAESILADFDYVGTTEALTEGIAKVCELIREPGAERAVPLQTVNANDHTQLTDPDLLDVVEQEVTFDKKLYAKYSDTS